MAKTVDNETLFKEYNKTKDAKIREQIIINNASVVKIVAKRMYTRLGGTVALEDLESYGILGLIESIDRYDLSTNNKFETFASFRIQGAILDALRRLDWVPRSVRSMERNINTVVQNYQNDYGRNPTEEEVAAELNVPVEKIYDYQSLMVRNNLASLDTEIRNENANNNDASDSYSVLIDPKAYTPEELYLKEKELPKILDQALALLTENERKVILMVYYEEMTLKEVSLVMEVSESRISQLHTKGLQKMRDKLENGKELMALFK